MPGEYSVSRADPAYRLRHVEDKGKDPNRRHKDKGDFQDELNQETRDGPQTRPGKANSHQPRAAKRPSPRTAGGPVKERADTPSIDDEEHLLNVEV